MEKKNLKRNNPIKGRERKMTNPLKRVTMTMVKPDKVKAEQFFTVIRTGFQPDIQKEIVAINGQILEQLVQAYKFGLRSAFPERASENLWRLKQNLGLPHLISAVHNMGKREYVDYINSLHFTLEDIDANRGSATNEIYIYQDRYNKHVTDIEVDGRRTCVSLAMGAYKARKNTWTSNLEYTIQSKMELDIEAMYTLLADLEKTKIWDVVHNFDTMNFSSKDNFVFEFTTTSECDIEELFRLLSYDVVGEMNITSHTIIPEPKSFSAGSGRVVRQGDARKLVK